MLNSRDYLRMAAAAAETARNHLARGGEIGASLALAAAETAKAYALMAQAAATLEVS